MKTLVLTSLLTVTSIFCFSQNEEEPKKGDYSIAIHGFGWGNKNNYDLTRIMLGGQADFQITDKPWYRISAGANYYYRGYLDPKYGQYQLTTFGGGISFPIRKGWFLYQPAVHGVYMLSNSSSSESPYFRQFDGGGVKVIMDFAVKVKQFDIGLHVDYSFAYGKIKSNNDPSLIYRNHGYNQHMSVGIFFQYNRHR
ncbi:MAG: hypothetical protein QNK23_09460 [Crocinitomicaceae bacterium]|nr:hypothetical protein [Crocinitomicaceae bacterium]